MFFNERQLLLQFLRLHAQLPALTMGLFEA